MDVGCWLNVRIRYLLGEVIGRWGEVSRSESTPRDGHPVGVVSLREPWTWMGVRFWDLRGFTDDPWVPVVMRFGGGWPTNGCDC